MLAVLEEAPGSSDERVLEASRIAQAILVTMDRDDGELVFHRGLAPPAGILYFRVIPAHPREPAERLLALLDLPGLDLRGFMTVVQREGFRQRPLPARSTPD